MSHPPNTARQWFRARLDPVKAARAFTWPAGSALPCDHAGLLLLFPAMAELGADSPS